MFFTCLAQSLFTSILTVLTLTPADVYITSLIYTLVLNVTLHLLPCTPKVYDYTVKLWCYFHTKSSGPIGTTVILKFTSIRVELYYFGVADLHRYLGVNAQQRNMTNQHPLMLASTPLCSPARSCECTIRCRYDTVKNIIETLDGG